MLLNDLINTYRCFEFYKGYLYLGILSHVLGHGEVN